MSMTVRGLHLARGERMLVDHLDLDLPDGAIHAVIGGNGSGKSTLVATLAGDLPILRGEVFLDGDPLTALDDAEQARRRAVLTQHPPALPFSARDLIELAAPGWEAPEIEATLSQFDLVELADRRVASLSGGERGRALLAMAAARQCTTMLLDEPTAAFDREYRSRFLDWLRLWRGQGRAILVVTHDAEIERIADLVTSLD